MIEIVESLCHAASFKAGDRVSTLRGTNHGVIVRVMDDGRIVWKSDGSSMEMVALPENLVLEQ